jgi:twitching motility protein PilT
MVPAVEIMVATARVKELISDPKRLREIRDAIATGRDPYGMISFDQCLTELVQKRLVTYADAAAASSNPADFALHFKGVSKGGAADMDAGAGRPVPPATARPAAPQAAAPGGAGSGPGFQIDRIKE